MTEIVQSPITIMISRDSSKPKKRINLLIDEDLVDAITQFAALNSVPKGEIIEKMAESWFSAPIAEGKWRIGRKP